MESKVEGKTKLKPISVAELMKHVPAPLIEDLIEYTLDEGTGGFDGELCERYGYACGVAFGRIYPNPPTDHRQGDEQIGEPVQQLIEATQQHMEQHEVNEEHVPIATYFTKHSVEILALLKDA